MASPNPDPLSPTLADDIAPPSPGKRATVADTGTTGHSALHTRQFGAHDRPVGTVYPDRGPVAAYPGNQRAIPQRQARLAGDAEAHDFDHEARGMDTMMNAGHLRAQAHVQSAEDDPFIKNLMGDQRSPAARAQGRARYAAAIDRAGHDKQNG